MNARAAFAFVAVFLFAGRTPAGNVDKTKLRELAHLPTLRFLTGFGYSSISGLRFGENPDHLAEIARLQKQMRGDPSDAERYILIGRHYSMTKHEKEAKQAWSKAAVICRQQVRERPDDVGWLIQLGEALTYTEKAKEGEQLLRRAIAEAPNEWRGWLALADEVNASSFRDILKGKHWSFTICDGKTLIPALMQGKPTDKQIAEMRRLRTEALRLYDRAVDLAPPDEAKPHLRRLISNANYQAIEAVIRMSRGEKINPMTAFLTPECLPDMRRIAHLSPDDPQKVGALMLWEIFTCVYHNQLEMKEDLSSWADYLAMWNRTLVDVLPAENRESVRWCMERLEQLTHHPDRATAAAASQTLVEGLMTIKTFGESLDISCPIRSMKKDSLAKVSEQLGRVVRLDPSSERAWDLLTMMLAVEKKTADAIAVAAERLALKDNAHNRFFLAKIYTDNDQFDKAAAELNAGLQNDPKDLHCRLGLIALALKRGEPQAWQEAGKQLKAVLPRVKEAKDNQMWLDFCLLEGISFALNDHPDGAKEIFQRILKLKKGEAKATRALVALDGPLGPADQQLAMDFIQGRGGRVRRKGSETDSPVWIVDLKGDDIKDEDLFALSAFPQLQYLNLDYSAVSDAGLANLKHLTALRGLCLNFSGITDKGLIHLKTLRGLSGLSLGNTAITDSGLAQLEALPYLESLIIGVSKDSKHGETITDAGLSHLRKLAKLRDITVVSSITDEGLAHLAAIPRLRQLILLSSKVTDEGMQHLERLTELQELWLSGAEITDAGLERLKGLQKLKKLHLGGTKITDAGLAHLKELSQLEELELNATAISDAGLAHLHGLTNLRKLNLRDCDRRKTNPTVSKKPPLTGQGLKHLQGLTKLKYLDLDGRPITDAGLSEIEKLTQVEYLSLGTTSITDEGLAHLLPLRQLHLVNVKSTKVTRQGVAELRKTLPKVEVYR